MPAGMESAGSYSLAVLFPTFCVCLWQKGFALVVYPSLNFGTGPAFSCPHELSLQSQHAVVTHLLYSLNVIEWKTSRVT